MVKLLALASIAMIAVTGSVTLAAEDNPTIEELLTTGWQIAGTARRSITAQRSFSFTIQINLISCSAE